MGWTVLYVGFGFVALWLLGEVLLQYKARLRWRMLAFTGFLGVAAGVLLHSVPVIVAGAIAFAVGQTYVTLSFRRGFSTGWAVGGSPGASRRRKGGTGGAVKDPALEVSDIEYGSAAPGQDPADQQAGYEQQPVYQGAGYDEAAAYDPNSHDPNSHDPSGYDRPAHEPAAAAADFAGIHAPQPLPDDTGQYGIYSDTAYGTAAQYGTYDTTGYDRSGQEYPGQFDDGAGQQQYAAYSDPYVGSGQVGSGQYDASYGGRQQYADPYAGQYANDTPPGGVWVPQQRENEPPYGAPEQPVQDPRRDGGPINGYSEQQNRY